MNKFLGGLAALALCLAGCANPATQAGADRAVIGGYYSLAIDDGPTSNTSTLINILKNAGVKGCWFLIGNKISANPSAVTALVSAGMQIGNHSYTHQHMTSWTYQQVFNDLQQAQTAIQNAGGGTPKYFRPPYLEVNSTIQQAAAALGLTIVTTTVDTQDWNGASTSQIVANANNVQANGIPLMHDGYTTTDQAIPTIVTNLRNRGLEPGIITGASQVSVWPGSGGTPTPNPTPTPTPGSVTLNSWQASSYSSGLNVWTGGVGNWTVGAWMSFNSVNITGKTRLNFNLASTGSGSFQVRLDSTGGTQIGQLNYTSTGSWTTYNNQAATLTLNGQSGSHTLYIVDSAGAANLGALTLQ